jgi:hypothetical protein
LIDPVVRQAYFFKRPITRKTLEQQNGPFVAKLVARKIHLLDLTGLVNDNLKQAVCSLLIDSTES